MTSGASSESIEGNGEAASFRLDFVIFGSNALFALGLNLAVFLVVGKTSALTLNVADVVKDWLLIGFSWSVIKDTVTAVNLVGYLLAFMGVVYYNHSKFEGASGSGGAEEEAAHAR
jgi:hypothetical protein